MADFHSFISRRGPLADNSCGTERGVALVVVLALIALGTVLVVAFLAGVTAEGVGQRAAVSENNASQLAATAVQLVEGTISYATEPRLDTTFAWACQPGMIRTYGSVGGGPGATAQGTASASPLAYYKLYSSDNMILSGTAACNAYTASNTDVPQQWDTLPSLYTDLNAPLLRTITTNGVASSTPIFPIVDPRAADLGVEGFEYARASLDGAVQPTGSYSSDSKIRLPMPGAVDVRAQGRHDDRADDGQRDERDLGRSRRRPDADGRQPHRGSGSLLDGMTSAPR